jgi:hypothetical protein
VTRLIGKPVYNDMNQNIGTLDDVIISKSSPTTTTTTTTTSSGGATITTGNAGTTTTTGNANTTSPGVSATGAANPTNATNPDRLFAILQVGGFLGLGGHLVAVQFDSLMIPADGSKLVLPGANKDIITKLPEFVYRQT